MAGVADEASLIARIAAGDTAALRDLFARHHVRVYRFILRLVRSPAVAEDPEVAAQKVDKGAILRRCLDVLSPEHKGIIDLVYYHEMSVAEAAEILQIPENTVKTRLFHARKQLSKLLKQVGVDRGWP
jgi:DNA-directed RNA polymerase specialized sigma24 family protein